MTQRRRLDSAGPRRNRYHRIQPRDSLCHGRKCSTHDAARPVALHGGASTEHGKPGAENVETIGHHSHAYETLAAFDARATDGGEPAASAQAMAAVHPVFAGVKRFRPLRRRALRTCLPPGVAMRTRKPCVLRR
jgi:hypothetical protein